jgi:hypothetical protein
VVARLVWPRDPANPLQYTPTAPKDDNNLPIVYAAYSAGFLGRMYLRGEGVKADPAIAKMWFERGSELGDRECQNGLGIIWRDGLVPSIKADPKKAMAYFAAAAGQELAEAQINVAKHHFGEFFILCSERQYLRERSSSWRNTSGRNVIAHRTPVWLTFRSLLLLGPDPVCPSGHSWSARCFFFQSMCNGRVILQDCIRTRRMGR